MDPVGALGGKAKQSILTIMPLSSACASLLATLLLNFPLRMLRNISHRSISHAKGARSHTPAFFLPRCFPCAAHAAASFSSAPSTVGFDPTPRKRSARVQVDTVAFPDRVAQLFEKLEAGLKGMVEHNVGFAVQKQGRFDSLTVVTGVAGRGNFSISSDTAQSTVTLVSPKDGGQHTYRYDVRSGQWVDVSNGHFLLELLTRDIIYICKGYPSF